MQRISQAQIKYIRSLHTKKYRQKYKQFFVEGTKCVHEFLASDLAVSQILATKEWISQHNNSIKDVDVVEVSDKEMKKISAMSTPSSVLAVVNMPGISSLEEKDNPSFILVLDNIKDPGNMGTMIRTADWFGCRTILCSMACVECWNPKVVQSSMGSLSRINMHYTDIVSFVKRHPNHQLVAATLNGENVHSFRWPENVLLAIGSESRGLSDELISLSHHQVTIPGSGNAESLNAAISGAILMNQYFGAM